MTETEESRPPWAEEYEKRVRMIKAAKWIMYIKNRKFTLELEAEPELLEQLIISPFCFGDAMHLIVSNMEITHVRFHYKKRVKEYVLPKGQTSLDHIEEDMSKECQDCVHYGEYCSSSIAPRALLRGYDEEKKKWVQGDCEGYAPKVKPP